MMRVLVPSLLILASVAAMASQPRFLGPPVKKPPADAGQSSAPPGAADAGTDAGAQPETRPPRPGDVDGKKAPKEDR